MVLWWACCLYDLLVPVLSGEFVVDVCIVGWFAFFPHDVLAVLVVALWLSSF